MGILPGKRVITRKIEAQHRRITSEKHGLLSQVHYVHDGSEESSDSIGLQVKFFNHSLGAPVYNNHSLGAPVYYNHSLEAPVFMLGGGAHTFSLVVQVAPWNDVPRLVLPPDDTFVIIAGTTVKVELCPSTGHL